MIISGRHLEAVTEVRVGEISIPRARLEIGPKAIVFRLADDLFPTDPATRDAQGRSVEGQLEGRPLPVRVVAGGREFLTFETLRYFIDTPTVTSLEPAVFAPGRVVVLRGRGFDPTKLENNHASVVREGGGTCCDPRNPSAPPSPECAAAPDEPACAPAQILSVSSDLVVIMLPARLPAGLVRVDYSNLAFLGMDAGKTYWTEQLAQSEGSYYGAPPPKAAASGSFSAGDYAGTDDALAGSPAAFAWRDIGELTRRVEAGGALSIRATGRLCYPATDDRGAIRRDAAGNLLLDARVKIWLDDLEVKPSPVCLAGEPAALWVPGYASWLSTGSTRHTLRVSNELFDSNILAWGK